MQGLESLSQFKNFVSSLGGLGRYGDTYMVHAEEGETVVPMEVLDRNPVLKKRLFKSMKALGIDPGRYIVGNDLNSLNPVTGQPEFFLKWVGRRLRKAAADVSGYAAPIVGAMYGPAAGALTGGLLGQYKRENPGDPYQGTQMALRGGMSGIAANLASGQGFTPFGGARGIYTTDAAGNVAKTWNPVELGRRAIDEPMKFLKTKDDKWRFMEGFSGDKKITSGEVDRIDSQIELVENQITALDPKSIDYDKNFKKLNREIIDLDALKRTAKEALDTGMDVSWKDLLGVGALGTVALGSLIGEPEDITIDESQIASYTPHGLSYEELLKEPTIDYGYNIPFAAKGGIMDLQGGGESRGPGTGTSDSIPAMLSDGEFVMTADAVRGAGGGDRREGARKMYEAMNRLEARV